MLYCLRMSKNKTQKVSKSVSTARPTDILKKRRRLVRKLVPENESDSTYFLKLVLYIILGSLWIKFLHPIPLGSFVFNGFPIGLVLGVFFVSHDNFQINRKIGYAIMIIMTILTYFLPAGIVI